MNIVIYKSKCDRMTGNTYLNITTLVAVIINIALKSWLVFSIIIRYVNEQSVINQLHKRVWRHQKVPLESSNKI